MKLKGVRVIDLGMYLPTPHLTLMMADHGAEVIRVEPPGGEPARAYGPFEAGPGGQSQSVWFRNLHRGKRALCLDLKHPDGKEILCKLAERADVLVEGFRPGVMDRLGLGYKDLKARNPRLVYCAVSAFGHSGPLYGKATHDMGAQALTGFLAINDNGDGKPVVPGFPSADMASAMMGLAGILMALYRREQTGQGDFVDATMYDSLLSFSAHLTGPVLAEGRPPTTRTGRSIGGAAFYNVYETKDGRFIVLSGREPKFAETLLGHLGRPDLVPLCLVDDCVAQEPVKVFLAGAFRQKTQAEWIEILSKMDLGWAPVLDMAEAIAQPQAAARGMVLTDEQGRKHIGNPIKFAEEPAKFGFDSPALNQDAEAIVASLGYSPADYARMAGAGVFGRTG
ncbi:MAG: CoA transferase [Rhodospirillaceae bacterium]|nr:CoA transferase [Rhodospirillaceae bacterium]